MNAMADGAAQRLVAQIGEALFGQPGLTLMELAERVKGMQPCPAGRVDALVTDPMVMAALQAVTRETLAGVGDTDSKVIGVLTAYGVDGAVHIPAMVRAMLQAALAASQPVGVDLRGQVRNLIQHAEAGPDSVSALLGLGVITDPDVTRLAALLQVRQPVGQEPVTVEAVATVRRNSDGDRYIDWLTEGGIADLEAGDVLMVSDRRITDESGSGEVYTTPPAQAVDLGQFVPAERPLAYLKVATYHEAIGWNECRRSMLALIDGKAVVNG